MSKYEIGQEVFHIKWVENRPMLLSFEIGCIKHTKKGTTYGVGTPGCVWVKEDLCFPTIDELLKATIVLLEQMVENQVNQISEDFIDE